MNVDKFKDLKNVVNNYNVLIVEDDLLISEQLQRILKKLFKNLYIAVDGNDGFNKYIENNIDIVISDIKMPKVDGFKMLKMIRNINNNVPIIFLSAYNESEYFIESIKLGIDGYLLKPIEINQLIDSIYKATTKIKLQDEISKSTYFLKQHQEATNNSVIVSKTDIYGNITYVNDKFCETSGYTKEELIGRSQNIVRHPKNPSSIFKKMWKTIKEDKKIWNGVIRNINKNGESYYVDSTIKPILDINNNIIEYISLRKDITNIMSPKKLLSDLINNCIEPIVVMMKIEYFDDMEKYYGLNTSEKIEKKFQEEFFKLLPNRCEFDHIYSLGDGIYALAKDKALCKYSTQEIIYNLKELQKATTNTKIDIGNLKYDVSVIMSISYGKDALSNVKYGLENIQNSKHKFIIANDLTTKEHDVAQNNLQTLIMVKDAIDNLNIVSHFQPIINNKTKKIEKYESLVRLINSKGEILSPFLFLDTAKKGQYYSQITDIVLENSFAALTITDADISINLSILDIEKDFTREKIFSLLNKNKKNMNRIVFELLEDETVKDFELVKSFIYKVKKMGVKIAIDDFGAGYSNFERLLDYQPDILKIDGSLVKNIDTNSLSLHLVETITTFAKKQNIKTIAEFVENEKIFNILNKLGVDYSQGYYFGKPSILKSNILK